MRFALAVNQWAGVTVNPLQYALICGVEMCIRDRNFTIPIFIGNMFQQIYNMADTIIVGKFVGNAALAAVGSCGTLTVSYTHLRCERNENGG